MGNTFRKKNLYTLNPLIEYRSAGPAAYLLIVLIQLYNLNKLETRGSLYEEDSFGY